MSNEAVIQNDEFVEQVWQACQQVPITKYLPKDIFVVGFPKSGNTWFQNFSAGILYGFDVAITPDSVIQELVPDVHYKRFYKRFGTPTIFKSHERARSDYRRVVYLLRDGRDVMVSYRHYRSALLGREPTPEEIDSFADEDARSWSRHVSEWLDNPYQAELIKIRFEDLLTDPVRELRRFCEFGGFERKEQFLRTLAEQASFVSMRAKEIRFGWNNPAWPRNRFFLRRGIAGSYQDELDPRHLEIFLKYGADTLLRNGYPAS